MGGSPQGAGPKALLYRNTVASKFTTAPIPGSENWLIKFPVRHEHVEVCAIEAVYAECLRQCGVAAPDATYFNLPSGQATFATHRLDCDQSIRISIRSLAVLTGANYQTPGALDYRDFLRAAQICTNDVREEAKTFEHVVFNAVLNNRDGHPKNFTYLMSVDGDWILAPAYDATQYERPGEYHQMGMQGEALDIERKHLQSLGVQEAELSADHTNDIIEKVCHFATVLSAVARDRYPNQMAQSMLRTI